MSNLLPCPFCGADGPVLELEEGYFCKTRPSDPFGVTLFSVPCNDDEFCGMTGPFSETMEGAIKEWNTRAEPTEAMIEAGGDAAYRICGPGHGEYAAEHIYIAMITAMGEEQ